MIIETSKAIIHTYKKHVIKIKKKKLWRKK